MTSIKNINYIKKQVDLIEPEELEGSIIDIINFLTDMADKHGYGARIAYWELSHMFAVYKSTEFTKDMKIEDLKRSIKDHERYIASNNKSIREHKASIKRLLADIEEVTNND